VEALQLQNASAEHLRRILHCAAAAAEELEAGTVQRQRLLLSDLLDRVSLGPTSIRIEVRTARLASMLSYPDAEAMGRFQHTFGFSVPIQLKRRGV
jgi:hypothetical protein